MRYETPEEVVAKIENNFRHHPPKGDQVDRFSDIRTTALNYVKMICEFCPHSRERSIALKSVEDSVLWAIQSISRNEK